MKMEMEMQIVPFATIGPLQFGQSRASVRQQLGNHYSTFKKDVGDHDTDAYDDLRLHLYYDDEDRLEFVEIFAPTNPTFNGISFLGRLESDVAFDLSAMGFKCDIGDVGLTCDPAGIRFVETEGVIEAVAVFRKGYYGPT